MLIFVFVAEKRYSQTVTTRSPTSYIGELLTAPGRCKNICCIRPKAEINVAKWCTKTCLRLGLLHCLITSPPLACSRSWQRSATAVRLDRSEHRFWLHVGEEGAPIQSYPLQQHGGAEFSSDSKPLRFFLQYRLHHKYKFWLRKDAFNQM